MARTISENRHNQINDIFGLMSEGMTLRTSCKMVGTDHQKILELISRHDDLRSRYIIARQQMIDVQAEELDEIGKRAAESDSATEVAGLRLQSDNRKWLIARLAPQKYGDKIQVGGADDLGPVKTVTRIELVALKPNKDDSSQD